MSKKELLNYDKSIKVESKISAQDFFNNEMRLYSAHSNVRGIPFIGDGFKEAQRKSVWGMLDRGENAGLISVERVSSAIASCTDYHHGVVSLQGTIIGLAQTFAGSNNMNFFEPEGQFGSRGSPTASAARYIMTRLHDNFRKIFKKEDDIILEQKISGDLKVEPKYFIPLLPVVLLNGAEGMGTGHSTHIFAYKPDDLKQSILKVLDGKQLIDNELKPWWSDFKGEVIRESSGQIKISGSYVAINSTEINVTELPVGMHSDKYEEILFKLEDQEKIKSFKNASDDQGFDFKIKVPRTTSFMDKEELMKLFKLESRDTENLTVWNPDGEIEKYESVEKLLIAFVGWRLDRYEDRRIKQIEITSTQISWIEEVIRFIEFYLSKSKEFRNAGKKELIELLTSNKFTLPEKLLSMSIWTLTKDNCDDLLKKLEVEKKKLSLLEVDNPKKMYKRELNDLKL